MIDMLFHVFKNRESNYPIREMPNVGVSSVIALGLKDRLILEL